MTLQERATLLKEAQGLQLHHRPARDSGQLTPRLGGLLRASDSLFHATTHTCECDCGKHHEGARFDAMLNSHSQLTDAHNFQATTENFQAKSTSLVKFTFPVSQ